MLDQTTAHPSICFILFRAGAYQGALPIDSVQRVVAAVEVAPLPNAPSSVRGAINVRGQVVPVMDLRARLGLSPREILPDDHLVLAHTTRRLVALLVDGVDEVIRLDKDTLEIGRDSAAFLPDLPAIHGASLLDDELILIHDLETFLSPSETQLLENSLTALESPDPNDANTA